MRVDNSGPNDVRVAFANSDSNSQISATCVNGKPSGYVSNDD